MTDEQFLKLESLITNLDDRILKLTAALIANAAANRAINTQIVMKNYAEALREIENPSTDY